MNQTNAIIKELGGPTKVATAIGVKVNVVGNWSLREYIPWHWHDQLLDLARNIGVTLTRDQLKAMAPAPKFAKPKRRAA